MKFVIAKKNAINLSSFIQFTEDVLKKAAKNNSNLKYNEKTGELTMIIQDKDLSPGMLDDFKKRFTQRFKEQS